MVSEVHVEGGEMMATFTAKHYEKLADFLGQHMAESAYWDDELLDALVKMLSKDNPRFKPTRFLRAVQRAAGERPFA